MLVVLQNLVDESAYQMPQPGDITLTMTFMNYEFLLEKV